MISIDTQDINSFEQRSLDEIGFYTISENRARTVANHYLQNDPLGYEIVRTEIILGKACNLNCRFCKSLPETEKSQVTMANVDMLLRDWLPGGTKFVHLTGGEPTLHPEIKKIVMKITNSGSVSCMTSNGTAPFSLYADLVERGLRDIRISLHACNRGDNRWISGKDSVFETIVSNIQRLVDLRDRHYPDLYIMINTCVMEETIAGLPDLLHFLAGFNPDDIKPVAIVQWSGNKLEQMRRTYNREILPLVMETLDAQQLPILRYRLPFLLTSRLRGFVGQETHETTRAVPNCYLMLDDRCVDSEFYYPCNIYIRERGAPLGRYTEDDPETVAWRVWDFVQNHDVRKDPICRTCCPDVVREYNSYVALLLEGKKEEMEESATLVC